MNKLRYIFSASVILIGLSSCLKDDLREHEKDTSIPEVPVDFTKYVSIGNSLTAGYADGGVYKEGQENSFPNILAKALGTDMKQALTSDAGTGHMALAGMTPAGPNIVNVAPDASWATKYTDGTLNNYGVPGIRAVDMGLPGYGVANPHMSRFIENDKIASTNYDDIISAAVEDATFVTFWLGNNDVLGFASSGGVYGVDGDPTVGAHKLNGLPELSVFSPNIDFITKTLKEKRAIFANIPPVEAAPYFTTVGMQVYAGVNGNPNYNLSAIEAELMDSIYTWAGYSLPGGGNDFFQEGQNFPISEVGVSANMEVEQLTLMGDNMDFVLLPFGAETAKLQTEGLGLINAPNYLNEFNFVKNTGLITYLDKAIAGVTPLNTLLSSLKGISANGGGGLTIDQVEAGTPLTAEEAAAIKGGLSALGVDDATISAATVDQLLAALAPHDVTPDAVKPLMVVLILESGMASTEAEALAYISTLDVAGTLTFLNGAKTKAATDMMTAAAGAGLTVDPSDQSSIVAALVTSSKRLANPIKTMYVLDDMEAKLVKDKTAEFNSYIKSHVEGNPNWILMDSNALMKDLVDGITVDGVNLSADYITGNAFSLDGIHLTPKGYAYIAKKMVEIINSEWDQSLTEPNISEFRGIKTTSGN
jgi:lysophospholipase L1-like esterase